MQRHNNHVYSPDTLEMLYRVLNECMSTVEGAMGDKERMEVRIRLAQALLTAIESGERSPSTLKVIGFKRLFKFP